MSGTFRPGLAENSDSECVDAQQMSCSYCFVACRGTRSKIRFSPMRHKRPRPSLRIRLVSMTRWSAFRVPQILNRSKCAWAIRHETAPTEWVHSSECRMKLPSWESLLPPVPPAR